MSPIIPIILAAVLGFGMGYKLKDCLCKGKKSSDLPDIKNLLPKSPKASKNDTAQKSETLFSLHSIDKLFSRYNIPLTSDYSFSRLLDAMEKDSYVAILKYIDASIASPNELFHYLNNEEFNVSSIEVIKSSGEPYLTQDVVNTLLEDNNVNNTNLETIEEKVQFLLMLAQGKGVKRFQESLGNDLSSFLDKYNKGENTDIVFESIKTIIHDRLGFYNII